MMRAFLRGLFAAALAVFLTGCGSDGDGTAGTGGTGGTAETGGSGGTGGDSCSSGEEGCACYGNGTCNEGLTCTSDLCVVSTGEGRTDGGAANGGAGGEGGTDVDGGGVATGGEGGTTGGTGGTGGMDGGTSGTGGTDAGSGGTGGVGGTGGSGGSSGGGGTGGSAGEGGTGGAGGSTGLCAAFPSAKFCTGDGERDRVEAQPYYDAGGPVTPAECSAGWECCDSGQVANYFVSCTESGSNWDCECEINDVLVGTFISSGNECSEANAEAGCGWQIPDEGALCAAAPGARFCIGDSAGAYVNREVPNMDDGGASSMDGATPSEAGSASYGCSASWDCCDDGLKAEYSVSCTGSGDSWDCECDLNDVLVGSFSSAGEECSEDEVEVGCGWQIPDEGALCAAAPDARFCLGESGDRSVDGEDDPSSVDGGASSVDGGASSMDGGGTSNMDGATPGEAGSASNGCSAIWDCCDNGLRAEYSVSCAESAGIVTCDCELNDEAVGDFISSGNECSLEEAEIGCGWDIP